jgi:hypothetical protein
MRDLLRQVRSVRSEARAEKIMDEVERRARVRRVLPRKCAYCGKTFTPKRKDGKYHSARCRVAANRAKRKAA